jgi:hypothetical protein
MQGATVNMSDLPAIDRKVRQNDGSTLLSSRHIRCETCRGYVDNRWYPRCYISKNEVQITGTSAEQKSTADDGECSESTLEEEVVTVRSNPMTPIPRRNSDDSSNTNSDATEGEVEQEIFSMYYECNVRVPIQMKINGTCHGRCFYCHRRQRHLVCAAVNPDKMIDGIPHSWCERCHQYVTAGTLLNSSCHGPCLYCGSRVIHDKCTPDSSLQRLHNGIRINL